MSVKASSAVRAVRQDVRMVDDVRPVLVTGGTGTLGRALVHTLLDAGRPVRVLSRREPSPAVPDAVEWVVGDLLTGDGLHEAVTGVSAVVHCATDPRKPDDDLDAAVQLLLAARAASVPHLLYVSIVGVDRVPFAYYKAKHRVEEIVEDGGVPWTILRATQFHEFARQIFDQFRLGPIALVPRMVSQPVAAREVAERLVSLAEGAPAGHATELGGPEVLRMSTMVKMYARAIGSRGPVLELPLPGGFGRAMRDGTVLSGPAADRGIQTYDEWVATL